MYAQKNYLEIQGINGKYRVSQIGCFLTSFCNLLERFGKGVSPLQLNAFMRDNGHYIDVDDGIRDDLRWDSITKYNANVKISRTGTGIPPSNNCIVKFSGLESRFGTHFCLVADASKGTIVDSWDGQVKHWSTYGGPKSWAEYVDASPKPTTPPPSTNSPVIMPAINEKIRLTSGVTRSTFKAGTTTKVGSIHATDNTFIYEVRGYDPHFRNRIIINSKSGGGNGVALALYDTANKRIDGWEIYVKPSTPPAPTVQPSQPPTPEPTPTVEPTPAPEPVIEPTPEPVVPKIAEPVKAVSYKDSFVPEDKIYISKENVDVLDMDGLHINKKLGKSQRVNSGGTFIKDGVTYVRTKKSIADGKWYGVPVTLLSEGQDSSKYVGPLGSQPETDDDFNLDIATELRQMMVDKLSIHEQVIITIAKIQGFFIRIARSFKKKK